MGENKLVGDMAYEKIGTLSLDYKPCRYGGSKLLFRGPKRKLTGNYVAFIGGTETYGKFIEAPFPDLIEQQTGVTCVNFGWPNAGVDVFLNERAILDACEGAQAVVLQLPCAQNMTNRFYSVHPRRNDRFVGPSNLMKSVFRDIDFTEFHFTRHMLNNLKAMAPERFNMIRDELQSAWVARMKLLLNRIDNRVILLWFSARHPGEGNNSADLAKDPAFVTRAMLDAVRGRAAAVVKVCASPLVKAQGTAGMVFSELEANAAAELLGPMAHEEAAKALVPIIKKTLA
ncbi:DUF6473 family protein [Roseovarius sp. 2305UL8-3]|uniref:DUF6473 family protein n=1 Tax=Roseovarius conchicola TaxID=3121636 RepID=UPI003527C86D